MGKVVLLDRDGVINAETTNYVKSPAELEVFPYAKDALDRLREAGYLRYIVSNQSGVGRGLMTLADLNKVTEKLISSVGPFEGVFYCTHKPDDGCDCRKPLPGLLYKALADAEKRGPVSELWMVGDSSIDIASGAAAGCRTVLISAGHNSDCDPLEFDTPPDYLARNLAEAVDIILSGNRAN
jgi:D-glycero-D-manno-heptose 1,7-bisphosphate phosphatase